MSGTMTDRALEEAARWYAELQDEAVPAEVWQRFLAWERHPENAAAFRQIEAALQTLDRSRHKLGKTAVLEKKRQVWPWIAAMAAALVLVAGVLVQPGASPALVEEPVVEVYATAIGEQRAVSLADGSAARLNTATRIEVRYTGDERRVSVLEGQALFEVARGAVPFVVSAGDTETTALGTVFDVYRSSGGVQVTLLEGLVTVAAGGAGGDGVVLSPGDQLLAEGGKVRVEQVDAARAVSWQSGMIAFTDVTLGEAVAELNRYSEVKLQVEGALADERLSGAFRAGDQAGFAAAMAVFLEARVEHQGEVILLTAGRPG